MVSVDKEIVFLIFYVFGGVVCLCCIWCIGIGVLIFVVLFGLFGFFVVLLLICYVVEQQLSKQFDWLVMIQCIVLNLYMLNFEVDGIYFGECGGQGDFIDIGKLVVWLLWLLLFCGVLIVNEV